MIKRTLTRGIAATVLVAGLVAATPSAAAAHPYYRIKKCTKAQSLATYTSSTSNQRYPKEIYFNTQIWAAQEANGRYHVGWTDYYGNSYSGWISADPAWTYNGDCHSPS